MSFTKSNSKTSKLVTPTLKPSILIFLVFPQFTSGEKKYSISIEPGSTKSVTWVTEEDLSDGLVTDGIEFTVEILEDVMLESGIFVADERTDIERPMDC